MSSKRTWLSGMRIKADVHQMEHLSDKECLQGWTTCARRGGSARDLPRRRSSSARPGYSKGLSPLQLVCAELTTTGKRMTCRFETLTICSCSQHTSFSQARASSIFIFLNSGERITLQPFWNPSSSRFLVDLGF